MTSEAIQKITQALLAGKPADAQPWDLSAAVQFIVDNLGRKDTDVYAVRNATEILNKCRHFEQTRMLAQAWNDRSGFDSTIAKHHAQALIELSALDAAEEVLQHALKQTDGSTSPQSQRESPEYAGLCARIDKQRFVLTKDSDFLANATERYLKQYEDDTTRYWHGINAAALRAREEREGLKTVRSVTASELAQRIYDHVTRLDLQRSEWIAATASEASLTLGNCEQAELWLYRFLHHPKANPFSIGSYHRQIREIWEGDANGQGCADRLASILSRHIVQTQREWAVSPADVPAMREAVQNNPAVFEKNFLGESTFSFKMVELMLSACSWIGCVLNRQGERLGTGFLVEARWLKEAFGDRRVFVTNAHVISDLVPHAIKRSDALVSFEVESAVARKPVFYEIDDVLYTSIPGDLGAAAQADDKLDVTIVSLKDLPGEYRNLTAATQLPLVEAKTKAYVIGHPRGSGLQISLHDSRLLDIDDDERLIHYRTPTDPGSSGSPVFNEEWNVIGIHHAGSGETPRLHGPGTYEANEAIALGAIRRKLNS